MPWTKLSFFNKPTSLFYFTEEGSLLKEKVALNFTTNITNSLACNVAGTDQKMMRIKKKTTDLTFIKQKQQK